MSVAKSTTSEESILNTIDHFESVHRNYVAIINPNTNRAMMNLKKFGECTLIDPRACINHLESRADTACVLYSPISMRYFHYMVFCSYVANKTRLVLNDTKNDTYVWVIAENINKGDGSEGNSVESIIRNAKCSDAQCRPGIDILYAGTPDKVGYFFHQPTSFFRRKASSKVSAITSRIMNGKEWAKRLKQEKEHYDCVRALDHEGPKDALNNIIGCRPTARLNPKRPTDGPWHIPILMIQSSEFGIVDPNTHNARL